MVTYSFVFEHLVGNVLYSCHMGIRILD